MRVKQRPGYMTVPATARRLNVNYRTVLAMLRRGDLRGGRHGHARVWWISTDSVAAWITARVDAALAAIAITNQQETADAEQDSEVAAA